jgi:hypothetical protein
MRRAHYLDLVRALRVAEKRCPVEAALYGIAALSAAQREELEARYNATYKNSTPRLSLRFSRGSAATDGPIPASPPAPGQPLPSPRPQQEDK